VFVTADAVRWLSTDDFVQQHKSAFKDAKTAPSVVDEGLPETRRWVLYDLDSNTLLGTRVYMDSAEAVEDAAQVKDILVLPLVIQGSVGLPDTAS
jgi:hypothetical protein